MVSLQTVVVAGIHYLIHPQKLASITATINPDSILPVTLLASHEIFNEDLEGILAGLDAVDDVFIPEFGSVLVEKDPKKQLTNDYARLEITRDVFQLNSSDSLLQGLSHLPSGPYILHGPNLYQAWRLYEDEYDAFVFGVIHEDANAPEEFRVLNALSTNGLHKAIPVPSRLYHRKPSLEKPLSGIRVSVSDTASLRGVGTTLSSTSWVSLYPDTASESSRTAKRLLDLGAVIVGRTKIPPLESGQDWVDVSQPRNPRADGYQKADDGSPGAATAVAGYPWLQYALVEQAALDDSNMSGGVYSLQFSLPNQAKERSFSQPGPETLRVIGRELQSLSIIAKAVVDSRVPSLDTKSEGRVLFLTDLAPALPSDQSKSFDKLISVLESSLAVKAERTSLAALWDAKPPVNAGNVPLAEFITDAPFKATCYRGFHKYQGFRDEYRGKFHQQPFIEDHTRFRWKYGSQVTKDQYALASSRIDVFKAWFRDTVLGQSSSTLVVFPHGVALPHYRQQRPEAPNVIAGITFSLLPTLLDTPHLLLPFDQISFDSTVSGKTEQLPISASILGGGSWSDLIRTTDSALKSAGWPREVSTGKLAFPLNDVAIEIASPGEAQDEL